MTGQVHSDRRSSGASSFEDWRWIFHLVDECVDHKKRGMRIVWLCGPRGSGQSELLEYLETCFKTGRPCVRLNEPLGIQRPHQVALLLAFHLSEKVERFGWLRFPRLFLGVAATRGPVNFDNRTATRAEIIKRIIRDRTLLKDLIRETASVLINLVGTPLDSRLHNLAVEAMLAVIEAMPIFGGRHLRWYRDELGKRDSVDALVTLAKAEADGQLAKVDGVLCRAFLADLREGCTTKFPHVWDRGKTCLVLFDAAGTEAVHEFLDLVAAQRHDWGPLLIVAASSSRAPTADQERRTKQDTREGSTALYHIELRGLKLDEAVEYFAYRSLQPHRDDIDVAGVLGGADKAFRFAWRLTGGHFDGFRHVLRTISRQCHSVGAENVDVRGVLTWIDHRGNRPALPDEILQLLIGKWPASIRRALIGSTAARDFGDEELAEALRVEPLEVASTMVDFRSRDLWVQHCSAQQPILHPFPRRAVMHLLAVPAMPGDPTWSDVHQRMQVRAEKRGDTASAMYHCLARGEILTVAEYLSELFMTVGTQRWFDITQVITEAPLAQPARGSGPEEHWQLLVGDADDSLVVKKRLVAALQLHNDPLGDPCHSLCPVIAQELEELARDPLRGALNLYKQAKKFRGCSLVRPYFWTGGKSVKNS